MSPGVPQPAEAPGEELGRKLAAIRATLRHGGLAGLRLRGLDWFAWLTCGGSAAVLLAAETGVAEALVTVDGAWVLTDDIERARLEAEELPPGIALASRAWWDAPATERFVAERCGDGPVASDRPRGAERPLPADLAATRSSLGPEELARYRALGREAAEALTDVLGEARPGWTGFELAAASAEALWSRRIHPALALVGDARRLPLFRHPTPSADRLGDRAMLVVCARRHGLYANLTRFVYFRPPTPEERRLTADVARVEAAVLAASRPGTTLGELFEAIVDAYASAGHAGEEVRHHQGGPCGYLPRDALATPGAPLRLAAGGAVAWNPSLPGAKIEDTAVVHEGGAIELLTVDPRWPTLEVDGRRRPDLLLR